MELSSGQFNYSPYSGFRKSPHNLIPLELDLVCPFLSSNNRRYWAFKWPTVKWLVDSHQINATQRPTEISQLNYSTVVMRNVQVKELQVAGKMDKYTYKVISKLDCPLLYLNINWKASLLHSFWYSYPSSSARAMNSSSSSFVTCKATSTFAPISPYSNTRIS